MNGLPATTYELVAAPLAGALSFLHVARALGPVRAAVELLALVLYGYSLERVAIAVFASHRYTSAWRIAPGGVPLAVAAVWAALIVSALALAARLGFRAPLARGAAAALLGISLDLLMEPVAVRAGLWVWTPPGPWLGIPIGNFVGWAVIVGVYGYGAERFGEEAGLGHAAGKRATLSVASIAALVAIGLVWRALGAERLFVAGTGWLVWAALLLATAALGLGTRGANRPASLAGRPASPAVLPLGVFAVITAAFATDAVLRGDPSLRVVAAGTALVYLCIARRIWRGRPLEWWRFRNRDALAGAPGLIAVLMKERNGQSWSPEEKAFLRTELRALARLTPMLLLFLLPGSLLLLPLYAWLLDRRRTRRLRAPG